MQENQVYFEGRFSGSGGQGIMLAGQILAEAAGVYEGRNVVQTRSYGPEARGGASRSEVIISREPIDTLEVSEPDFLLALTQEAFDRYTGDLKSNAIVVIDPGFVRKKRKLTERISIYSVPVTAIALDRVGSIVCANVVALGVMGELTRIVKQQSLREAVRKAVPAGTEEINLKALDEGYRAACHAVR